MNKLILIAILALSALLLGAGCSTLKPIDALNAVLPNSGYTQQSLNYGGLPRQALDIYRPKLAKPNAPPILFVYGGAWREGDKKDYVFVAHALTSLGHTVIIPNYRLYPQVQFPAFIQDLALALAYTERHATQLLGKPLDRFIVMGHSSGAHTAALLATRPHYLRAQGVSAQLVGLIGMAGPYDLPLDLPEVSQVFGAATADQVKPVVNIPVNMPRSLLLHGAADDRVIPRHTQVFAASLAQAGHAVEVRIYPKVDHVKLLAGLAQPLRALSPSYDTIAQFLASY